ncbi:MAG: DJ-1/PfpI family protein [Patescibacteria group bacterium]|nr:DJ-1/PfpI family protein [Patescibacteria group bacterium]
MNALFLIAKQDFRDEELFEPKQILEEAGIQTTITSTETGTAVGKLGGTAQIDLPIQEVNHEDYDILIIVGGPGAPALADHPKVINLVKKCSESGKKLAAICIAPYILAKAGVLTGKKATTFPAEPALSEFDKNNVIKTEKSVVKDGNILTADGPNSAKEFGQTIVNMLQ